jgi:hypothetical protein
MVQHTILTMKNWAMVYYLEDRTGSSYIVIDGVVRRLWSTVIVDLNELWSQSGGWRPSDDASTGSRWRRATAGQGIRVPVPVAVWWVIIIFFRVVSCDPPQPQAARRPASQRQLVPQPFLPSADGLANARRHCSSSKLAQSNSAPKIPGNFNSCGVPTKRF